MILEDATFKKFGYYPSDLRPQTRKLIIAACDDCGVIRSIRKDSYRTLCHSCAMKGNINSLGFKHTDESKALMSVAQKGEKNHIWKGGKKIRNARDKAKRKRDLGYTLLIPLKEGEEGHHVSDVYVLGIPKEIHKQLGGYGREIHRTLVLQWLKANDKKKYIKVLSILAKETFK